MYKTSALRERDGQYRHAMANVDNLFPVTKMIRHTLNDALDTIRVNLSNMSKEEVGENPAQEIREALSYCLGKPLAKSFATVPKHATSWNGYQTDNSKRIRETYLADHGTSLLLLMN